jgi:fucose 4-O-acetylase-like acetyltransferase
MNNNTEKIYNWISKAFNLPALKKSRLHWVDYLKGIAIILVVYRHSLLGIERSGAYVPHYLVNANMIFYSFRMPLFFMLSGIFVSRTLAKKSVQQFIASKFETLIYPYFIWVFIQVTLQIILSGYTNSERTLIDYTYIFYQPRNLDQFWYLPALFNATVIYVLIKRFVTQKWWILLAIGMGFYFLSSHLQQISMISDWMEFFIFFALGDTISTFFFQERVQQFFKNYSTLLLALPVFVFVQIYYLNHPVIQDLTYPLSQLQFLAIALTGCFTMLAFSFRLQCWNVFSWLRVLGYHSLFIYVMHVMVAALIRTILAHVFGLHDVPVTLVLCIIGGSVIPVIIYNLFILNNIGWFLFTFKKPKKQKANNKTATQATVTA